MNFSQHAMRGAEIWHIWRQHHQIECFWKVLKSVFHIRAMRLQDHGLYTALLIKVLAYLLALRLKAHRAFSKYSIVQLMRQVRREEDLGHLIDEHFHGAYLAT